MMNFKHLFKRRLEGVPVKVVIGVLAVALIGFADAAYLTIEHYRNVVPPCTTGGCEQVLTSAYATVYGIPVALLGTIYYLVIAIGLFASLESGNHEVLRVTLLLTVLGLLASVWFIFLQVFIIHSYCLYCMGSALSSTTLFVLAAVIFEKYKKAVEIKSDISEIL